MEDIDIQISDALLEKPIVFRIGERYYYVYPMTIGKFHLMKRIVDSLGLNLGRTDTELEVGLLGAVKEKRDLCCELLAYMTARNDYYSVFDMQSFLERKEEMSRLGDGDIASLLLLVLMSDKTDSYMKRLGIDVEQKHLRKVSEVKAETDKNTYTFGGVSIFGTLIDAAMERYALTKRQVVWEIDYTSLRLLLADRVNTIFVSEEERKKINIPRDRRRVNGDDREEVMRAIKSQSWE